MNSNKQIVQQIYKAVQQNKISVIKYLLHQKVIDINAKYTEGNTLLHLVIQFGCSDHTLVFNVREAIEFLLNTGADQSILNDIGIAPLHYAAQKGSVDSAQVLIKNRAMVDIKSIFNYTPLHYAASNNKPNIIKILIEAGADTSILNYRGLAPLHYAAQDGFDDSAKALIKGGAIVDIKSNYGLTALHCAAANNYITTIELLTENGANLNAEDDGGYTPLDLAVGQGHREAIAFLLTKGGKYCTHENDQINIDLDRATTEAQTGKKNVWELQITENLSQNITNHYISYADQTLLGNFFNSAQDGIIEPLNTCFFNTFINVDEDIDRNGELPAENSHL
ncbi:MAG: ankyrin repeat domain-containing protein [Rickettsiaceae bacterium]|nr:MAG: ankyrin repeat domain-containing protein [Rickettsiaceae bacterium]